MSIPEYKVKQGGLMRCCCLQSLSEIVEEAKEPFPEGHIVKCKWCKGEGMILKGDTFEWAAKPITF